MKKMMLSLTLLLVGTVCSAQERAFTSFAEHFGQSAALAYVHMGDRPVLLVSHEVFGNDEDEGLEAIAASLFALDADGKMVSLGSVRSQGTLYPVSLSGDKLMVAGHRFVSVYQIRGEEPELTLFSHEEGDSEDPKLKQMFQDFENATPVRFKRK